MRSGVGRRAGVKYLILIVGGCFAVAGIAMLLHSSGGYDAFLERLRNDLSPALFFVLMSVLPVAGFPMSPFLVMAGLKFGFLMGVTAAGLATLIHLICAFGVGRSFLRPWIIRLLKRRNHRIPRLSRGGKYLTTFLFVAFPGLPYSLKNYLLAISDLSLTTYIGLTWISQMLVALPFIGLGEAAGQMHLAVGAGVVLIILVGYLTMKSVARRHRRKNNGEPTDTSP